MSSAVSQHPFSFGSRHTEWFLPAMLIPSLYVMLSFAFSLATGSHALCSTSLLLLAGGVAVVLGAWVILHEPGPLHRRICAFCALLTLVYLQLLLPRLWNWPAVV